LKPQLSALLVLLGAAPAFCQEVRVPSPGVVPVAEALVSELGCLNCHSAGALPIERLAPKAAPLLDEVGARRTPGSLRAYLAAPHEARPGTSMPDMLAALPEVERTQALEDLVHYLSSRGGPLDLEPFEATQNMLEEGRQLLHEVGCVACHIPEEPVDDLYEPFQFGERASAGADATEEDDRYVAPGILDPPPVPFGDLARQTSVAALARFLIDPVAVRPSGRMPSLELSPTEARDIAVYLLREQGAEIGYHDVPGVGFSYYEETFASGEVLLEGLTPVRRGVLLDELVLLEHREDFFALEFDGTLQLSEGGTFNFRTASDDGSWVYVDGEEVVDNSGFHPVVSNEGSIDLEPGDHSVRIVYFEHSGGNELEVFWSGPGFEERPLRGDDLVHRTLPMRPLASSEFVLDLERVERGEALFSELGCVACHETQEPQAAALDGCDVDSERGCLSPTPARGAARYGWSTEQAAAVRSLLGNTQTLVPPTSAEKASHMMARFRCYACHSRQGIGGPHPERSDYFFATEDLDLGEEGRIPPHLDSVGAKLRFAWITEVLVQGATARPYLVTRMPQFGKAAMDEVQESLVLADRVEDPPEPRAFSTESLSAGRQLVGTSGFGCIQCHTFNGYRSLGIPAVDLADVVDHIQYPWFRELLRDPAGINMNTRMPGFWIDGKSPVQDVLDGDIDAQIDAMWTYLSMGRSMPLPPGLDVPDSAYELEPIDEPRLVGVFMKGLSPRVVAVGNPEHVHFAFDIENSRLGLAWRGRFFNARGTWEGRAGQLELPASEDVYELPPGSPFALLDDPDAEWPETIGRAPALRSLGRRYDEERRPIFRYALGDIEIEETPVAHIENEEGVLMRHFRVSSPAPIENLFFRGVESRRPVAFEALPGGGFRAEFEERITW